VPPQQTRNAADGSDTKTPHKFGYTKIDTLGSNATSREYHAQLREYDADVRERKKPTDGELFECRQIISGNMYGIVMELWLPFSAHNDLVPKHESFYRVHLAYEYNDLQPRHFELELQAEPPLPAVERQLVAEQQLARV
jgi:hypothetical protein